MPKSLHLVWLLCLAPATALADSRCAALAGAHGNAVQVTTATFITPSPTFLPPAHLGAPAAVSVPFCRVEGLIHKRIGFELWLPPASAWNGRLLGAGVGGDAGVFNFRDLARGVAAGYASATTDGGHKSSEARWMMRRDAVLDYTHRAQHLTNQAVRKLIAHYYGAGPHHAYFIGCSGGGRQGLKQAQRYAADYDGIVAGAGGARMPEMSVRHLWHALYQQDHPEGSLDGTAWARVAAAAVRSCDADDGAVDGVVDHPPSCGFDVGSMQCGASSEPGCLSAAQVQTVRRLQQPLRDENGRALDSGLLPGVTVRPGPPSPLLLPFFAEGAHRNPAWNPASFNLARDLALARQRMPEMAADDPDLGRFAARGGKLILYQGWLDPSIIASQSIDYAEAVRTKLGARSDEMLRLYMVPGMLHCRGGAGADEFGGSGSVLPVGDADRDLLSAVVDWVENGKAPQGIAAAKLESSGTTHQRLLCPYPLVAKPAGTDAAAQRCVAQPVAINNAATSARRIDGHHAGGARWAIDVPSAWNGTLLLYARGYGAGPADQAPETAPRGMREELLRKGYALGASNYSGREWALEEAPGDQMEVLEAFIAQTGKPRRVIAWGSSMGGLVSMAMAEKHADRLSGALPLCGSVGGSLGMLNTALDGAFVFQTLVANDPQLRVVRPDDDRANARRVQVALESAWKTPTGRARVLLAAAVAQLPTWTDPEAPQPAKRDYAAQGEQMRRAFAMGVFVPRTDQERRAGGVTSWNTGVDYARQLHISGLRSLVRHAYREAGLDLNADLARLAAAPRIAADPRAVAYMRANYVPTGQLRIPVLTLQTIGDGVTIPAIHGGLQAIVNDAGHRDSLAQLWIKGAGHCTFSPAELYAALQTLEQRLDTGRWSVDPKDVAKRSADLPGTTRFTRYTPPALLRACGAEPGSCAGEPR